MVYGLSPLRSHVEEKDLLPTWTSVRLFFLLVLLFWSLSVKQKKGCCEWEGGRQCDQVWQISPLCQTCLQVFGKFLTVYFLFCKILSLLGQICDIIGPIFIVANGQILTNNLTIWSHCVQAKEPQAWHLARIEVLTLDLAVTDGWGRDRSSWDVQSRDLCAKQKARTCSWCHKQILV